MVTVTQEQAPASASMDGKVSGGTCLIFPFFFGHLKIVMILLTKYVVKIIIVLCLVMFYLQ